MGNLLDAITGKAVYRALEESAAMDRYGDALALSNSRNEELQEDVRFLTESVHEIEEDLLRISDAFDNVGWSPMANEDARELPLATVKKVADVARAMYAMNPFVKRGVNARIQYVWGKGVKFDGIGNITDQYKLNRSKMFTPQAYEELERVLATDGNSFTALPIVDTVRNQPASAFRISLSEIDGAISNPYDKEEVWYFKRSYKVTTTDRETGKQEEKVVTKYYASLSYYQKLQAVGKSLPKRWNKHGVEQNFVVQHMAVNKQVGWRWGVPDVLPVIFWAKAYKEYLEDNAMLVKAYSRIAWQITPTNAQQGAATSARLVQQPSRDPMTGELNNVGGTYVGSQSMTPTTATGSTVDFAKGSALASAIASGLEVSKVVITSDPGEGNRATAETLDLPTLKAMESRQQVHIERFMEIFEFWGASVDLNLTGQTLSVEEEMAQESAGTKPSASKHATVVYPPIESDSNKDHVAAMGTLVELGVLFKSEARREALEMLNITPVKPWWELPTLEDDPAKQEEQDRADEKAADALAKSEADAQSASVIAKQGVSGGISAKGGAMTSNNEARDNRAKDSQKS